MAVAAVVSKHRIIEMFETTYTARCWLRIHPTQPHLIYNTGGQDLDDYHVTQAALLRSEPLRAAVLERPEVQQVEALWKQRDPVEWLGRHMKVSFPGNAQLMEISLTGSDPQQVATLLGAVVDVYLVQFAEGDRAKVQAQVEQLDGSIDRTQAELRAKLQDLKRVESKLSPSERKAATSPELQMLRTEVRHLQNMFDSLTARRVRLRVELNAPPRVTLIREVEVPLTPD
jgi:uncharacterized protein involved in exopolysaccharide biosynthesis